MYTLITRDNIFIIITGCTYLEKEENGMRNKICKIFIVGILLVFAITGCSFSQEDNKESETVYDEPVLKLSSDYTVGKYIYKDGKEYYVHQNELVEHKPDWKMFLGKIDGEEYTFQWYEESGEIIISREYDTEEYQFEAIEGCTTHVLLVLQDRQSSDATYKLCDLENNNITSLFEGRLEEYTTDYIQLSSDLSYAIVSADKGENRFVFDGETEYPLYELVNGDKDHSYGARFVEDQILILGTEAYLWNCDDRTIKKTVDTLHEDSLHKDVYMFYSLDETFRITNLVTGATVDTKLVFDNLYYIYIVLDEQVIVATDEGNIMLLNSESGDVVAELETGLELKYSEIEENYAFDHIESDEGIYVALHKQGEDILIYKLAD